MRLLPRPARRLRRITSSMICVSTYYDDATEIRECHGLNLPARDSMRSRRFSRYLMVCRITPRAPLLPASRIANGFGTYHRLAAASRRTYIPPSMHLGGSAASSAT